jgi:hypothetical protein
LAVALLSGEGRAEIIGGILVGIGLMEILLFVGYLGTAAMSDPVQAPQPVTPASVIGTVGGLLVLAAGVIALRSPREA